MMDGLLVAVGWAMADSFWWIAGMAVCVWVVLRLTEGAAPGWCIIQKDVCQPFVGGTLKRAS